MSSAVKATKTNQRVWALLPKSWRDIADGTRDVRELDDEEVFQGRLRRADKVLGPRPSFYPQNFIDEQVRRSLSFADENIRDGAREAITVLRSIMNNPNAFDSDRIAAAKLFIDRFLGKEVQRVLLSADDPVESLFRAILEDPKGLTGEPVGVEHTTIRGELAPPSAAPELSEDELDMLS